MPAGIKKGLLSKSFLIKEYIKNRKTAQQIGIETGRSKTNILKTLEKYKIPKRKFREPKNILNQRFGNLVAIECLGQNNNTRTSYRWKCQCDCGKIKIIEVGRLTRKYNGVKTCGKCKIFHDIPYSIWTRNRHSARHEWHLTDDYLWDLYEKQNKKCALSGENLYFAKSFKEIKEGKHNISLDRIDSAKSYIEGNVQWVTIEINMMKQRLSQEQFIKSCEKVYLWQNKKS